ncbi:hypothetical protein X766_04005 [Mesorhizobium sp. LSJC255A00]|nr:hypothetical protein X766_04005 [Mesorhizobium sp. LSJC255A00]
MREGTKMAYALAMTFIALYGICGAVAVARMLVGR